MKYRNRSLIFYIDYSTRSDEHSHNEKRKAANLDFYAYKRIVLSLLILILIRHPLNQDGDNSLYQKPGSLC